MASLTDFQLEQYAEALKEHRVTKDHGSFMDKEIADAQLTSLAESAMGKVVAELQALRELFAAATTPDIVRDTPLVGDTALYWRRAARNATDTSDALFSLGEAYNHVVNQLYGQRDMYEAREYEVHRLARELNEALHGEEGAAAQASLCDLVGPAAKLLLEVKWFRARYGNISGIPEGGDGVWR